MLNYLVVLGGRGKPRETLRTVYALPVVNHTARYNGLLAKKNADPKTVNTEGYPPRFAFRGFADPATVPEDLFGPGDLPASVGGGAMDAGDITTIFAHNDAVFAVVSTPQEGYQSGIFHSQALFDSSGRIKQWTLWRRVAGNFFDTIFGAALDDHNGSMSMLVGQSQDAVYTVKRTVWGAGDAHGCAELVSWLNKHFYGPEGSAVVHGPIEGLFDFPPTTPGLAGVSVLVATGNASVALAQTGIVNNGVVTALGGTDLARDPRLFEHGLLSQPLASTTNAVAISGGDLDRVGIMEAACITRAGDAGYLFVGGVGGLAVLLGNDGASWDAREGLGDNLTGLQVASSFKKLGAYEFVRKLVSDDIRGLLYVVCDKSFFCIDSVRSDFLRNSLSTTVLAACGKGPLTADSTILDAVVTDSRMLLATSNGLFESSTLSVSWHPVCLPEGHCTVNQIYPITYDGRPQSLTSSSGGMAYVLNTQQATDRATLHRFTIDTGHGNILEQLPDLFVRDKPSYFVDFEGFRSWIACDGILLFNARDRARGVVRDRTCDRYGCQAPLLGILSSQVRSGVRFGGIDVHSAAINLDGTDILGPLVFLSPSGSWFLARDNVLTVNE